MILFPFATQATEPAPGASIEEPRLLLDGFFTDRKHKQTQANTGSTQTEHTHRHPRDHQRAREPRQARSQSPQVAHATVSISTPVTLNHSTQSLLSFSALGRWVGIQIPLKCHANS